jgi:hypothetical protein
MKRPNFNVATEVKVINKQSSFYGKRGRVHKIAVAVDDLIYDAAVDKTEIKDLYARGLESRMQWYVHVKIGERIYSFAATELEAVQHKFIDIDYIRETDLVIGKKADGTDAVRPRNTMAFEVGDIISITTKIDGANASIAWDETTGKLEIFSRTNLLDSPGALRGFYDYVKTEVEPKTDWSIYKDFVFFGEWCVSHTCKYDSSWYNKWRIYDIWCKSAGCYVSQERVKATCKLLGLEYIEELYYGPFISWDHCRSFLTKSTAYGSEQEGIVIKNQSKLTTEDRSAPAYLKIVNERFKESQHSKKDKKPIDPAIEAAKAEADKLASSVVTEARVRKLILKLIDEGKLPAELRPKDMGLVMKQLPKLMFDDVLKEEPETVKLLGEYAGKCIAAETAKQARKIVIGN